MTEFRSSAEAFAYHQKAMDAHIRKAMRDAEKAYRNSHPEAGALSVKQELIVYRKRPKGYSAYPLKVVGWYLTVKSALAEPNRVTVARLRDAYNPYPVPENALTRPIPPGTLKKVGELLAKHGKSVDLAKHNTVSKIKLALRGKAAADAAERVYEVEIAFAEDAVIVGGVRFPTQLHDKGYHRIRLGRDWLRCDVLENLVKAPA